MANAEGPIFRVSQSCQQHLEACVASPSLVGHEDSFQMRLADFNLWASGSGALANRYWSLDTRLAEEPNVHAVILNLLRLLKKLLGKCQHQEERPAFLDDGDSIPEIVSNDHIPVSRNLGDEEINSQGLLDTLDRIKRLITHLVRISLAIRRSGTQARLEKADGEFQKDRHGELESFLKFVVAVNALGMRYEEARLNPIVDRLIQANLRRRHRFLYFRRRAIKQSADVAQADNRQEKKPLPVELVKVEDSKTTPVKVRERSSSIIGTKRPATIRSLVASSTPTPLKDPIEIPAGSQTSIVAATSTVSNIIYPKAPKITEGQDLSKCPCCWQPLPVAFSKSSRWKRHMSEDIMPYTCVLENCPNPEILYLTRNEWTKHMEDHATARYWLCTVCLDPIQFDQEDLFIQHLHTEHSREIPSDEVPSIVDICSYTAVRGVSSCPLCLPNTGFNSQQGKGQEIDPALVLSHVAEHVHTFSLYSLPWLNAGDRELQYLGLHRNEVFDEEKWKYFADASDSSDVGSNDATKLSEESEDREAGLPEPVFEDKGPQDESSFHEGMAAPSVVEQTPAFGTAETSPYVPGRLVDSRPTDAFVEFVMRKQQDYEGRDGHGRSRSYLPLTELSAYWNGNRIRNACESYSERIIQVTDLNIIRTNYLRVFSTLVYIGSLSYLPAFQERGLSDQRFPDTTLPGFWNSSLAHKSMFEAFKRHQWMFFPVIIDRDSLNGRLLPPEQILPLSSEETLRRRDYEDRATISKIKFHPSCNNLVRDNDMTAADPAYVLKTYHGEQHEQHYQHEVQAFSRLLQNPSSIEHVVKCYATFKHGETYNLIMQWVSGGDLLEYFRNTPPPQTSEEIADFWGSLTKVMIGLPPIHQTTVPGEHSDEYQLVHQDIKPDNILVDPSPGPGLYQFNPIVADLGHSYTRHIKTDTSDIPAVDRRGNQTYCAPESSHHAGFRRTGPNRITSDADIFSAGAVFSDAASWVANGHDGRQEYAKRRHDCLVKEQGFVGYETGFHNGVERLRCVDEIHRDIRSNVSSHDKLTPRILDIVEEHMLSLPNYRLRASLLCGKFEQEILHAKAELPAALQDGEPSRRPNTPPEPSVTLPKLYTQPTIGKPNRIRSETEYRLSMADATAYCDAKKAKRSVDPKVESTVEELGKSLGKRDYLFFIDDTDSMKEYAPQIENAFRTLAYIAKSMDPDSLELSFVSDPLPVSKSGHTSPLVDKVKKCRYTAFPGQIESSLRTVILEKIIKHLPSTLPVVGNILRRGKPITIFVFTDGKWGDGIALGSGLDTPIRNLMNEVKKRWLNRTHVMFQFLRFGDNEEGIRHLEYLDQFGREEMWDMVDTRDINGDVPSMFLGTYLTGYEDNNDGAPTGIV